MTTRTLMYRYNTTCYLVKNYTKTWARHKTNDLSDYNSNKHFTAHLQFVVIALTNQIAPFLHGFFQVYERRLPHAHAAARIHGNQAVVTHVAHDDVDVIAARVPPVAECLTFVARNV